MPLLIFAGYPKTKLNAGGLQYAIEERMGIALLEHDKAVHYRKEGVFSGDTKEAEWLYPVEYRMSALCLRDGITWAWFPENTAFGNGVVVHKATANYEMKTVVHGTEESLDEYLRRSGPTCLSDLVLEQKHIWTEGWAKYEKRWLPGTCPQENHIVHLTWLITKHRLPEFAYERILRLIEVPGETVDEQLYEPRHFSATQIYTGRPALHAGVPGGLG